MKVILHDLDEKYNELLSKKCDHITALRRHKKYGERFARILLPSFVFIIFADIFFAIFSLIEGGIFRGWFSKKPIVVQEK